MSGLVVDIGNARLKWAEVRDGRLAARGHALHVDAPDDAFAKLAAALAPDVRRVVAANVGGPALGERLAAVTRARLGIEPELVATSRERFGVRCGYDDPARLGVDRWVAVIAAHRIAGGAACVVSAGTAVTFDAVDASGVHRGGLILAGPRLAAAALAEGTSNIGPTDLPAEKPEGIGVLGRSTAEAVGRGTMLGIAAAVDRAFDIVCRELGSRPPLYVTGGDAEMLAPWLATDSELRADLVLEGLALFLASPAGAD
ncbi:MAG TPA: type III pantothenate kinase [Gammaproteobacteria bacterium]